MLCQQELEKLDGQTSEMDPCCGVSSGNETVLFSNVGDYTGLSNDSRNCFSLYEKIKGRTLRSQRNI